MLEQTTRIFSENLARALNRRSFIKRSGQATFLGLAALAAGHGATSAFATKDQPNISCSPPGPYCSVNGVATDGCHGGSCFQHLTGGRVYQCRVYYQYYQGGCWTTASGGGYWTCCDCECVNDSGGRVATCGCAQFNQTPIPRPDGPGATVGA